MSEKLSVVEALSKVMADVQAVGKKSRNQEQGYNFRGVDAVVNAVGPELRRHGVLVLPVLESAQYRDVTTSRGKPSRECTVTVRYRFYGPAGDHIEVVVPGESMDFGDKGAAKAMSVAYRIALLQALCIPTDEPDADSQSYERGRAESWEVAKPPTPEQVSVAQILAEGIDKATDERDITETGVAVAYRLAQGEITQVQRDQLARRAAAKLAELRVGSGGGGES